MKRKQLVLQGLPKFMERNWLFTDKTVLLKIAEDDSCVVYAEPGEDRIFHIKISVHSSSG